VEEKGLENLSYRESSDWLELDQYVGDLHHQLQRYLHRQEPCRAPQRLRSWRRQKLRYRRCSTTKPAELKTSRWPYDRKLVLNLGGTLDMGRWLQLEATVDEMVTEMEMIHIAMTEEVLSLKQRTMRRKTLWKRRRPRSSCTG
jgi:hypothetical protein